MASWLPQQDGLLPKWLLFVRVQPSSFSPPDLRTDTMQISAVSVANAVASFFGASNARKVYAYTPVPVTDHGARLFGAWTLLSGVIRFYGAYYIDQPVVYDLVLWTFVIALGHFGAETLVWKTTGPRTAALSSYFVATASVVGMLSLRKEYVG